MCFDPPYFTFGKVFMSSPLEQARLLMPAIQKLAISAYAPLTQQYPDLAELMENVPKSRWDFFFITASIGVTFLLAPVQVAADAQSQVCDTVAGALEAWHPQGHEALEDFLKFVRDKLQQEVEMPAAVGAWLIWNLKQAQPSPEELKLAWPLGLFFLHSFKDWWESEQDKNVLH
jgi:hypothetical protein